MPSQPIFTIQPQRRSPRGGWLPCQPHQAQRWAVLRKGELLTTFSRRSEADARKAEVEKKAKPSASYTLGQRMAPRKPGRGLADNLFSDNNHREL